MGMSISGLDERKEHLVKSFATAIDTNFTVYKFKSDDVKVATLYLMEVLFDARCYLQNVERARHKRKLFMAKRRRRALKARRSGGMR